MIGREVFGYRVEELIGKGSFASVYKVKKKMNPVLMSAR